MKKKIAIGSIVFVLVLVSIYFYVAYNDSQQLNEEMSEIITLTIKEENVEKIEAFTKKVAGVGPAAKWFIDDYSEYEKFKQYYENYLIACANEVDKKFQS